MHDINAKCQRHFLAISIDPMTIEGASTIRTKMNTAKAFLASTNEYKAYTEGSLLYRRLDPAEEPEPGKGLERGGELRRGDGLSRRPGRVPSMGPEKVFFS